MSPAPSYSNHRQDIASLMASTLPGGRWASPIVTTRTYMNVPSSMVTRSPEWNQPSANASSVAVGLSQ